LLNADDDYLIDTG